MISQIPKKLNVVSTTSSKINGDFVGKLKRAQIN